MLPNTATTSPVISFGLFALSIKEDATPAYDRELQSFSKLNDLITGNVSNNPYITHEPDFWLLDGDYKFKPIDSLVHCSLMSLDMSGPDGVFTIAPKLTITFSGIHTTDGVNLRGLQHSEDWCNNLTIDFYDINDVLICSDTYYPITWEFSTFKPVQDFFKIVITFSSTNKPYRYLRLTGIDFGQLTYFRGTDIKEAKVVEELHPLSIILPVDTFELQVFSSDADFSILNPQGEYLALQEKQPMDVYEEIGGKDLMYMGRFYLDTWENPSETEVVFKCIDMLGVLNGIPYYGGLWEDTTALTILEDILGSNNIPYEIDPDIANTILTGWLPISSCREALQQVAFALGAFVSCARYGMLRIYESDLASELSSFDYEVTDAEKGIKETVTLAPLVTGVELTSHSFVETSSSMKELYNGSLVAGTHLITFQEPMHNLSITGGTISSSSANYAVLNVVTPGTVVLTGQIYVDVVRVVPVYNGTLDPSVKSNIVKIEKATLVSTDTVDALVQKIYNYYQQRYINKFRLFQPEPYVSSSVLLTSFYGQQIGGVVEKMNIDLARGFTADVEMTGVVQ